MARGRFILKDISLDDRLNNLSSDTARLLYTWLIPHLDCEGRMYGDAQAVKSIVLPRKQISIKKIEEFLQEIENQSLILRYFADKSQFLLVLDFATTQVGLRKERETQSQIPPPPPELVRSNDGVTPAEVKVSKVKYKLREGEGESSTDSDNKYKYLKGVGTPIPLHNEQGSLPPAELSGVLSYYEANIGKVSQETRQYITARLKTGYKDVWFTTAINEAVLNNKRSWPYVRTIAERLASEYLSTRDSSVKDSA